MPTGEQIKTVENDWNTYFEKKKVAVRLKAKAVKKNAEFEAKKQATTKKFAEIDAEKKKAEEERAAKILLTLKMVIYADHCVKPY